MHFDGAGSIARGWGWANNISVVAHSQSDDDITHSPAHSLWPAGWCSVAAIADIDLAHSPIRQRRVTSTLVIGSHVAVVVDGTPSVLCLHIGPHRQLLLHHESPDHASCRQSRHTRPHSTSHLGILRHPQRHHTHHGHQTRPGPRRPLHPRPRNREPKHLQAALKERRKQNPTMDQPG